MGGLKRDRIAKTNSRDHIPPYFDVFSRPVIHSMLFHPVPRCLFSRQRQELLWKRAQEKRVIAEREQLQAQMALMRVTDEADKSVRLEMVYGCVC